MSDSVDRHVIKALLDKLKRHDLNAYDYRKQLNLMLKLFEQLQQLVGETHSSNLVSSCSVDEDIRDSDRCLNGKDEQFQEAEALTKDPDFHFADLEHCERKYYSADANGQLLANDRQLLLQNNSLTRLHTKLDEVANDQRRHLNLAQTHWQQIMHMLTESTIKQNHPGEANKTLFGGDMKNEQQSAELVSCTIQEQQLSCALSQLQLRLDEANKTLADCEMKSEQQTVELMSCTIQGQQLSCALSQLQWQLDEANQQLVESSTKNDQLGWELTNCKLELLTSQELAARTKLRELENSKELNTVEVKSMISRLQVDTATMAEHIKTHIISKNQHISGESEPIDTRGFHSPDHLQRLRQNYQKLTEMLDARKVAASMYEHDALTFDELQSIQLRSTFSQAAKDLLKIILEAGNNIRIYECFMSALQKTNQQDIWSLLSYNGCDINSEHVQLIQSHYSYLVQTIEHSGLLSLLFARGVIDIQDMEYLQAEPITFKRIEKLLSMLVRKTEQQFELFLDCLNETNQGHVVEKLRGNSPGSSSENTEQKSTSSRGPNPLQETAELTSDDSSEAAAEVVPRSSPIQRPQRMSIEVTARSPHLCHVISSKGRGRVVGATVCDEKLFVLRAKSDEKIEQFEIKYQNKELKAIRVDGLSDGILYGAHSWHKSLTSCCINNCLYVNDRYSVFRVDLSTENVISWPVNGSPCGLSVNSKGNVLVTCHDDNKIIEYSTRGSLVRSIQLQVNHVNSPSHTVQLTDGRYVVCHYGPVEGVSLIDQHGARITSYTETQTTQLVNRPRWIVVVDDCILVADRNNNRILSLNSALNVAQELSLPVNTRLTGPCCMYIDQSMSRLFVGEWKGKHRVLVFDQFTSIEDLNSSFL